MLTVKHIQTNGTEDIYPATRVSYHPRRRPDGRTCSPQEGASDDVPASMFIDGPKGDTIALGGATGTFYVVNDAGKTVAKYDLGGWSGHAPDSSYTVRSDKDGSVAVTYTGSPLAGKRLG